ncbi:MAG: hypothetical protein ACEPOW_02760 [Bacteroidales bacterium]
MKIITPKMPMRFGKKRRVKNCIKIRVSYYQNDPYSEKIIIYNNSFASIKFSAFYLLTTQDIKIPVDIQEIEAQSYLIIPLDGLLWPSKYSPEEIEKLESSFCNSYFKIGKRNFSCCITKRCCKPEG